MKKIGNINLDFRLTIIDLVKNIFFNIENK